MGSVAHNPNPSMTHSFKNVIRIAALVAIATTIVTVIALVPKAHANPFQFVPTVQTALATTSPAYLAPGTATSTLIYDSFTQGQIKAADKGVLLLQTAASSTSSVYTIAVSYSQDGIDYYQDNTLLATSTITNVGTAQTFTFTAAGTATTSRAIPLTFPTRFVKVTASITGAAGAAWQQILPQRQSN